MPKTGENIYKRKDGRWEGRYIKGRIGGKIKYGYVYAVSYRDVKDKLHLSIESVKRKKASTPECFGIYADKWILSVKKQVKESTIVRYENILRLYVFPYFEKVSISDITNEDLNYFTNEMLSRGGKKCGGLSAKTVSGILSVMKSVFKYAAADGAAVNADTSSVTLRYEKKNMRVFTISEQRVLTECLCNDLNLSNLGIMLCLYTGLRIGELCALKWSDISFRDKTLSVKRTMQRIRSDSGERKTKIIISAPKSNCSVRTIPIPDFIADMLISLQCADDTYFLTGKPDKFAEPRTMLNRFKAVLKKCGIEDAGFHILRHTFATRCVELGVDIKSLSEILGHAGVNITLSRYVHPSIELKKKNMDRLSELLAVR